MEFAVLFPRFRSKERDLRRDIDRLSIILQAVMRAIAEARSESAGLTGRLNEARSRAALLYGDVIEDGRNRSGRGAAPINEAERQLMTGEQRRDELDDHLAFLAGLEKQLADVIAALRQQQRVED